MEVTIEKLKTINDQDSKPKAKKTLSVSDLKLDALSVTAPSILVAADVAEDENEYFSDYDSYFSDELEKKKPVAAVKLDVMEEEENDKTVDMAYKDYSLQAYTVHLDGHRILTVSTYSNAITAKWIREVLGCCRKKKGRGGEEIVVGVGVDRESLRYEKGGLKDTQYDIIQLCVGSQCLIYELPETCEDRYDKCPLRALFSDRRVIAAGVNMKAIAKKLSKDLEIEFSNVLDLNEMVVKLFEDFEECYLLDLKNYDLDLLGTMVLGQNWYIDRPKTRVEWFPDHSYWRYWRGGGLGMEKVKYSTYDAYLNYRIGTKLLEIKKVMKSTSSAGKKSNKKKGKNN